MRKDAAFAALLKPWWELFPRGALKIQPVPWRASMCRELYAFQVQVPEPCAGFETRWRSQCNAIELLLLASTIKPRVFMKQAWRYCSPPLNVQPDEDHVVPCRLIVVFKGQHADYPRWYLDALSLLLSPELCLLDWKGFDETREALLNMACAPHVRKQWDSMKIQVSIHLPSQLEEPVDTVLELLLHLRQKDKNTYIAASQRAYPFRLDSVKLDYEDSELIDNHRGISPKRLEWLKKLMAAGLTICSLRPIKCMGKIDRRHRAFVGEVLNAITAAPSGLTKSPDSCQGTQIVEARLMPSDQFASLCSGLMHSRGVKHFVLDGMARRSHHGDICVNYLSNALYALFHASASHTIHSLVIRELDLEDERIQHVLALFDSPAPLQVIYKSDSKLARAASSSSMPMSGSYVAIAHGDPIFLDKSLFMYVIASSSATMFPVIYSSQDLVSIVVPAYGQCWVRKTSIVATKADPFEDHPPQEQWNLKAHRITNLQIHLYEPERGIGGVLLLLKAIGEPLTSLSISISWSRALDISSFIDICLCCPNLTNLSLSGFLVRPGESLVTAYRSTKCRLTTLDLHGCCLESPDDTLLLAKVLGNPLTAIAQTIQSFRVLLDDQRMADEDSDEGEDDEDMLLPDPGVEGDEDDLEDDDADEGDEMVFAAGAHQDETTFETDVAALLSALETNYFLSYFEIQSEKNLKSKYRGQFEATSGRYLNDLYTPLSLRAKHAFLSVIKQARNQEDQESLGQLDMDLLLQIFYLASVPRRRTIVVNSEILQC